jgi:hypothetical protein
MKNIERGERRRGKIDIEVFFSVACSFQETKSGKFGRVLSGFCTNPLSAFENNCEIAIGR